MSTKDSVINNLPAMKILPPQLARLKKEEEEETWISGEELYTEGSSDEESCRSKIPTSNKTTVASALSIAKVHRPKSKTDIKKKKSSSSSSMSSDQNTLNTQSSSSKGRNSPISSVSDEDDDYPPDDEISWKANKEILKLQDEIIALEEHRENYPKICDKIEQVFENYFEKFSNLERVESENFLRKNEKLQEEIKVSLSHVDAVLDELNVKIESIKKTTRNVQIQNRLRLKKIIEHGPPQSKKLAENSKKFFELCPNINVKN